VSEGSQSCGVRVLVVDDYQPFANLLVGILWNHGYEARAAYSLKEALLAATAFTPHALVLDVGLPGSNRFEVAEKCEQRVPACRVLLTSAWDYEEEPEQVPEGFEVVPKGALMDRLFGFLDACKPSHYARAEGSPPARERACGQPVRRNGRSVRRHGISSPGAACAPPPRDGRPDTDRACPQSDRLAGQG
jgi:CheY-like chemotaxis protein